MKVLAELVGYQVRKSDLVRLADFMGCLIFVLDAKEAPTSSSWGRPYTRADQWINEFRTGVEIVNTSTPRRSSLDGCNSGCDLGKDKVFSKPCFPHSQNNGHLEGLCPTVDSKNATD